MHGFRLPAGALALAWACAAMAQPAAAAASGYRFEIAGAPSASGGHEIVLVRLIHVADGKAVSGAVIFESTADMGPMGMATMTGPVRPLGPQGDSYAFEVDPAMTGTWALHLGAKVQGEAETVRGTLDLKLVK